MGAVLAMPEVKKRLGEMGFTTIASSSAEAQKLVDSEMQRWARIIKLSGIKPD
jgi:tripartite-type tricarboxylate transporter receptor subunit TctC